MIENVAWIFLFFLLKGNMSREELLDKKKDVSDFEPPLEYGFDALKSFKAMHEERAKVFFAILKNIHHFRHKIRK